MFLYREKREREKLGVAGQCVLVYLKVYHIDFVCTECVATQSKLTVYVCVAGDRIT